MFDSVILQVFEDRAVEPGQESLIFLEKFFLMSNSKVNNYRRRSRRRLLEKID